MATCRECETQNEMTLCEKCIHGENCCDRKCHDEGDERALTYCAYFLDKSDYVKRERGEWIKKHRRFSTKYGWCVKPIFICSRCGIAYWSEQDFCEVCKADMRKEDNNA